MSDKIGKSNFNFKVKGNEGIIICITDFRLSRIISCMVEPVMMQNSLSQLGQKLFCLLSAEAGDRGAMCFNAFPAMVQTAVPHVMRVMRDH